MPIMLIDYMQFIKNSILRRLFPGKFDDSKYKINDNEEVLTIFGQRSSEYKTLKEADVTQLELQDVPKDAINTILNEINRLKNPSSAPKVITTEEINKIQEELKTALKTRITDDGLNVQKGVQTLHSCLIDKVFQTSSIGGFQYDKDNQGEVTNDSYLVAKKKFLTQQIGKFFEETGNDILENLSLIMKLKTQIVKS